jgi:DNA polymerase I-like protein with 3'-5' exonuclease and polymerase domains
MLINCDVKSLEVYTAADWYDDKVLKDELLQRIDLHSVNQERFKLPDRVTAKRFIFKLLYGATDYGYSVDPDFFGVGYSQKQWQGIIEEFYSKYRDIAKGHTRDIRFVKEKGYLEIPSGRYFPFDSRKVNPEQPWTLTKIKNYPINCSGF